MEATEARLRVLETQVNALDKRISDSRQDWQNSLSELMGALKQTQKALHYGDEGKPAIFITIDRLTRQQEARSRVLWWLLGIVSSGALLTLGGIVGKLLK